MRYTLSAASRTTLEASPEVQDHILGSLEMLFGTPQHPGYLRSQEWIDASFDPNHPERASDDGGSGELSEAEMAEVLADNRTRFARELEAIGRGARVDPTDYRRSAPDLSERIANIVADSAMPAGERQAELKALFEGYYPSLRDSAELYRQQCLHCHGVEGGGDGPTAGPRERPFLDPRPRDYRLGKFKFTAVKDKARPRRQDLYRVLDQGVYGTAMPSFRRFSAAERWGLVDYVRLLAIRGEVEQSLVATFEEEESLGAEAPLVAFQETWDKWQQAKEKVVSFDGEIPGLTAASLKRGDELYHDATKGNCASCHGDRGLGDGPAAFKIDEKGRRVSAYTDDWGDPILPRNLVQGLFRGGKRPIDIYRRIYAGINGGPMPGIGESKDAQGNPVLSSDDMWALVHYVRSLSERDDSLAAGPGSDHGGSGAGAGAGGGGGH